MSKEAVHQLNCFASYDVEFQSINEPDVSDFALDFSKADISLIVSLHVARQLFLKFG